MLKPLVGGMIILLCCAISSWTSYYLLTCELEFFSEALSRLFAVIRHPNALHSENVMAYDNAVSALGNICLFHPVTLLRFLLSGQINQQTQLVHPQNLTLHHEQQFERMHRRQAPSPRPVMNIEGSSLGRGEAGEPTLITFGE